MNKITCAIGYQHNDGAVSFRCLVDIPFNDVIKTLFFISNAAAVKKALSSTIVNGFSSYTDGSYRYKKSYKDITHCILCNNKYHYANHVKKWLKGALVFLFYKGKWHVNDPAFMRYDKWYDLRTYLRRGYYDYHHEQLSNIFGFDYFVYEVISYKKSYYITSKLDLYNFLRKEEILSFDIEKVNDDLEYQHETSLKNVHNREIKIKFIPPSKVIDALKFFNEHSKKIK